MLWFNHDGFHFHFITRVDADGRLMNGEFALFPIDCGDGFTVFNGQSSNVLTGNVADDATFSRLPVLMRPNVLREMVTSHETFVAFQTLESFLACVRPSMPLQLIGPGEALPTKQPIADKWSLSSVPPQVGSQMRRLAIDFIATWNVTDVLLLFVLSTSPFSIAAVWTSAGNSPQSPYHRLIVCV